MATKTTAKTPPAQSGPDTHRYTVLQVPVRHNGTQYAVGAELALTEQEASHLGGLVMPVDQAAAEGDTDPVSEQTA